MAKYIINLPEKTMIYLNLWKCEEGKCVWFETYTTSDLTPYTEPDREAIEDEVWKFAKKVRLEGFIDSNGALRGYISNFETYQEAKAKYESWKAEILVGYEVQHKELPELKIYVTDMDDNSFGGFALCRVEDVCDYGDRFSECNVHQYERTGRVFPNIVELLKKMGEEE